MAAALQMSVLTAPRSAVERPSPRPRRPSAAAAAAVAAAPSVAARSSTFVSRSATSRALGAAAGATRRRVPARTTAGFNPFAKADSGEGYPTGKLLMFTSKGSRAQIIEWYAMEKGIEMEPVNVDMRSGAHKKAPFTGVNPFGKMPAIQTADGTPIFESGAILLYLAGLAGELKTPEDYGTAAKWTLYANATYWTAAERGRGGPADQLKVLDDLLAESQFLTGDEFTVSDVAVGSYLYYTLAFFGERFSKFPNVARYLGDLMEMESFKQTCGAS